MPLLMSRSKSPEGAAGEPSSSGASFRSRSSASSSSSYRSNGGRSSQKAAELRARYEMAQAIQKPWPLHLLENGVKPNTSGGAPIGGSQRATRSSAPKSTSTSASTCSSSSSRRERAGVAAKHTELSSLDMDAASRSSKKKRNSSTSLDRLSLSPTLSNWIRRASRDSDKSSSGSADTTTSPSSSHTSPMHSPKDL
ncbi:hypothetical protein EX895_002275 [Sporisorium graminicola]|uniref:Uncharacterized protein n=1 Tax=Sporisorium graminicola TaxID=280036 RepID=A0A4U7KVE3_9BASI|nr:hypothetical protein EX895_002275 [Sporisorium graminicola]TKY88644.1 hypothetical protein EX895_002275 [Sporisorium graminicola]